MAANTGQTAPDDEWLSQVIEEILEPDLAIIDPHHHLWLRNGYTYLMPELARDLASGHNVVATVYAECHSMYRAEGPAEFRSIGETEFVRGQAAMSASGEFGPARACAAMFGNVDLTLGRAVRGLIEQHQHASGGCFRGVRLSSGWHEDKRVGNVAANRGLLLHPQVIDAIGVLNEEGLTLDCWLYHTQIHEVAAVADRYPDLTIVLNHVGSPILGGPYRGKADDVFSEWHEQMSSLSQRDNVLVKLGALPIRMPSFEGDRSMPPSSIEVAEAWRPWLHSSIELFGAKRCMFESNFPVQKRWCSYQVCWNAFKRIAESASADEKTDLFAGTAARAYGLQDVVV